MGPIIPLLTVVAFGILLVGPIMHRLKRPYLIVYLLAGELNSPIVLTLIKDQVTRS